MADLGGAAAADGTDPPRDGRWSAVEGLVLNPVFAQLSEADLAAVAAHADVRPVAPGGVLVAAGSRAEEFFVVAAGAVEVTTAEGGVRRHVATLGPGSLVGEIAAVVGGVRTADVTAVTAGRVVAVRRGGLDVLAERRPDLAALVVEGAVQRLRRLRLGSYLDALFAGTGDSVAGELEAAAVLRALAAGQVLFHQGGPPDDAYVVVSGRLRAEVAGADGEAVVLGDIGPGGLVGEAALVTDRPRSATVRALRDSEVAVLPRDRFQALLEAHPAAALQVLRTVVERATGGVTADVSDRGGGTTTVAVVAASPSADAAAFATELAAALTTMGRTAHLTSAEVDARLATPGIAHSRALEPGALRLAEWLAGVEADHDFVVLEADRDDTAWTRRCARQAERALLVAEAADTPAAAGVSPGLGEAFRAAHTTASLVLAHPPTTDLPSATAAWLARFDVADHHHVRLGDADDFARVARAVAGRSVALVLSGGGARGFAHLGAYQALREQGLPVDIVAGTSIGATMAAAIALHGDPVQARDHAREAFRGLRDYTLPLVALLRGRRIWANIRSGCAGRDIEDLWVPFVCMSTDLTRARPLVHRRGDLAQAIRASIALPGLLPPVAIDGSVVVDGGVLDNLPLEETRRIAPTATVIAVDVAPRRGPSTRDDLPPVVSGWGLLAKRVFRRRGGPRLHGIVAILLRATVVASARSRDEALERGLADCYLDLDLRGCGLLDFDAVDAVADRGRTEAGPRLREWLATPAAAGVARSPRRPAAAPPS